MLFLDFLWERCGERDADLRDFRTGDGERFDLLGDLDFVLEETQAEKMCPSAKELKLCRQMCR